MVLYSFGDSVLGILVLSGILLLPALLPVAATDHNLKLSAQSNSKGTFTNLDKLAMGNIQVSHACFLLFMLKS